MITLGDVFRRFADDYCQAHGRSLLPSHGRAIADILACRTPLLHAEHGFAMTRAPLALRPLQRRGPLVPLVQEPELPDMPP